MSLSNMRFPTPILFGIGAIKEVSKKFSSSGCKKPLLVTDRSVVSLDVFKVLQNLLEREGISYAVFF